MKYLKKKKRSLVQILVPVAAVVLVAVILIVVAIGGQEGEDTTLPTGTGETAPQVTDASEATGDASGEIDTGESSSEDPSGETRATEGSMSTEGTQATDATAATGDKENPSTNPDSGDEKEDQTTLITPYCTLKYPKEWADYLRVEVREGTPYTATYYADLESGKTQELFSISFGGSSESALGTVTTSAGETVPVHVSSADFQPDSSWSDREINIVHIMQEAMNDVLDSMAMTTVDQPSQEGPNLPEDDGEEMVIDTPYGELHYPSRWKEYLEVVVNEKSGYAVEFWCKMDGHDAVKLFTVHYGGTQGIAAGTAKDSNGKSVEVRMEVQELDLNDTWSNEEKSIAAAMQEDLNYLLSNLS